jgi:hypothetical protein
MQRATSYRSKPDDDLAGLIESLSSTTFFLVARSGPTVFNVRDEDGKIFKVTISNPHTCNCSNSSSTSGSNSSSSNNSLCIHKIFVLLKVLKIPQNHPLFYQTSLTDSEITLVLSGSCGGAPTASRITSASVRRQQSNSKKNDQNEQNIENTEGFVQRQVLDEDDHIQCPICQDDMCKEQGNTLRFGLAL